ncbi:MAG: M48 family metalloprotease [Flavobacteriales bacterium]|nr:M48 family metalloprotease [Flavobacteriales bacterium]
MDSTEQTSTIQLSPFPYHLALRNHLLARTKTWEWFSKEDNREKQNEETKKMLLKNAYRLDRVSSSQLYAIADEVCKILAIDAQVVMYQEMNSLQLNAGVVILDQEAHIILSGGIINLLDNDEMKSILAHELSHYLFYKTDEGQFETTNRIIVAMANDSGSEDAIIETARIYKLYMELFCDTGSLKVCNDYQTVIRALVKLDTGLTNVDASSFLEQANEILAGSNEVTGDYTHPESYIRAMALKLKSENHPEYLSTVKNWIEGKIDIDRLDIFKQKEMQTLTHDIIQLIVKPAWICSATVLNMCEQYFQNFSKSETKPLEKVSTVTSTAAESVKTYLSYVLFDFSRVDSSLENNPMAHTFEIAEQLGMHEDYERIIRKELKLSVKEFRNYISLAIKELQQTKESSNETIYNE